MEAQSTSATPLTPLIITAIRDEAPDVKTFFLAPANGIPLQYRAGQFLTFVFHHAGREDRRSYSLSSSPAAGDPMAITIKRVENGAHSRWLTDRAVAGDLLSCTGVAGLFTLPENTAHYPQILFFAAGIGITPVISLLKEILHKDDQCRAVLFYSNRNAREAVFRDELLALEAAYKGRLRIEWRFSNARDLMKARISKPYCRRC